MSLTVDRLEFVALWMGFEKEVLMPTRIRRQDKCMGRWQVIEQTGFIVTLAGNPKVSYEDRKKKLRVLYGSV
ncbi:MAG: hypothetical protein A2Y86_02295 [Candidatus Aminicenantes bacterium RBG_13_62_12]|nr:MAG: hypothetical protein A2Y86_02295 [Candidatus Aminicenantes bacterium RBG_13_62_12]